MQKDKNLDNKHLAIYQERLAALAFSTFFKIGPQKIKVLLNYFKNLHEAYWANFYNLKFAGLNDELINEFLIFRKNFVVQSSIKKLKEEKINFLCFKDHLYPKILKNIFDPPIVLYFKGNINLLTKKCLAVVGSREHSDYGELVINSILTSELTKNLVIVSGLALGIDTLAHQKTLENQGETIAVLGSSLEKSNIYPLQNKSLAENIIKNNGLLISEFPLNTKPWRRNFPLRNRIISGLSQAVLIIEAKKRSGSLITAYHALEQGREIMAVPGSVLSNFSVGTNYLISAGAKLIQSDKDILSFFNDSNFT